MDVTASINKIRTIRWADPTVTWGLVPTMGYLHRGHLSLVQLAQAENDKVAVTIFVNPTQFSPDEDLSTYPRALDRDLQLLAEAGVDLVFTPSNEVMYPAGFQTRITVSQVSQPLEGTARPTHFEGVATVVTKLFNIIQPTRAYFGQKDAQQTVVIRQLVRDLNLNVALTIGPTVREADGLALSSRNAYLLPAERQAATILYKALTTAARAYEMGEKNGRVLRQLMQDKIATEPLAHLDYVSVAHPDTLIELDSVEQGALLSLAVYFGRTRLIDNVLT